MTARKLFTTLALLGSVALVQLPAQAAEPSVVAPESPTRELKVHDKAPTSTSATTWPCAAGRKRA